MPQGTRRERDRQGRDNDYNRKNKDQKQKKGETSGAKKEREVKEVRIVSTLRLWIWPTSMIDNFFFFWPQVLLSLILVICNNKNSFQLSCEFKKVNVNHHLNALSLLVRLTLSASKLRHF